MCQNSLSTISKLFIEEKIYGARVRSDDLGGGIRRVQASTGPIRSAGMVSSCYLVGNALVDTSYAFVRAHVLAMFDVSTIEAILLTHHHEDHTANAAALQVRHGCPVYLSQPEARFEEGMHHLLPYRLVYWGTPEPYEPLEMPSEIVVGSRKFQTIRTPGHSRTHSCIFDTQTGTVFSGDLFVSTGASAVMTYENPYHLVASLRTVADLEPARLLSGHGLDLENPSKALRRKADAVEKASTQVVELDRLGFGLAEIREKVFDQGARKDLMMKVVTQGEFSRDNFIRASLRHRGSTLESLDSSSRLSLETS